LLQGWEGPAFTPCSQLYHGFSKTQAQVTHFLSSNYMKGAIKVPEMEHNILLTTP
jgi:hypothetical protein